MSGLKCFAPFPTALTSSWNSLSRRPVNAGSTAIQHALTQFVFADFRRDGIPLSLDAHRNFNKYPLAAGIKIIDGENVTRSATWLINLLVSMAGGEGGIRTHVRVSPKHAFQACAFNHSATSPLNGCLLEFTIPTAAERRAPAPAVSASQAHSEIVYFRPPLIYSCALISRLNRAGIKRHLCHSTARGFTCPSSRVANCSPLVWLSPLLPSCLVLPGLAAQRATADSLPPGSAQALPAVAPREQLLFDFGWKFTFGHGSDPARDLNFGFGQGDFAKTGDFKFSKAGFDDSKWRTLNLPHDWAVELPFVHDDAKIDDDSPMQSHGYKPLGRRYPETSVGWYRREFDIPASDLGRRISVEFDGVFRSVLVFVNGCFIGRNDNGYAPFHFDLTDFLAYGAKNYIVVRVDASFGDGWFYEGAGIYRHVWLTKMRRPAPGQVGIHGARRGERRLRQPVSRDRRRE